MGIFQNQKKVKIFLIIYIFCSSIHSKCRCNGEEKNKKIANFVFGDSIVDVGNNNYIISLSKANYVPNGIDFGMPTGRFTNGRTIVDIIGQELGLGEFPPPYLAPTTKGSVILQGVNYASGAGGILNETGVLFGGRLNMDAQLDNFANTRQDMIDMIGEEEAMEVLNKALYSVTMGSNDFINNYLTPGFSKLEQHLVTPQAFINSMIDKFRLQLTRLYNMGARKIVVVNVGPIGCIPYQRDINPTAGNDCVDFPNQLAQSFNSELKTLVNDLRSDLPDSILVYADSYRLFTHLLDNYQSYGFENGDSACCYASGRFGGLIPCGPTSKLCYDRSKYVFWDPYHPSDAANLVIAKRLIDGDTNDISPINFRQLVNS